MTRDGLFVRRDRLLSRGPISTADAVPAVVVVGFVGFDVVVDVVVVAVDALEGDTLGAVTAAADDDDNDAAGLCDRAGDFEGELVELERFGWLPLRFWVEPWMVGEICW